MSFSATSHPTPPPCRRIASNWLWTGNGFARRPLIALDATGRLAALDTCAEPDREPLTEFYAGVVVGGFPADWRTAFARLMQERRRPLAELLAEMEIPSPGQGPEEGIWVVLSGLEYDPPRLSAQAAIRLL